MKATVIVPTISGARAERSLAALAEAAAGAQVIVVDNGSGDPRIGAAVERLEGAELLRFDSNLGFSRAVNLAAARAEAEALVLVNDDCLCDPGFVERIVAPLDPADGVVMSAGVLRDPSRPGLIDSAGMELDRTLLVFDYLNGEPLGVLDRSPADPIGPCAAAAAFWRDAFAEAGGFDEGLFAYWEDVDLVLRLRRAGGRCRLAPEARADHEHSATLGSGSARKNYLIGFGRGYVLRKWGVLEPRRIPGVLARDLTICAGQAVVDRNLAGLKGRLRGLRSTHAREPYPGVLLGGASAPGLGANLRRRWSRRAHLRKRAG